MPTIGGLNYPAALGAGEQPCQIKMPCRISASLSPTSSSLAAAAAAAASVRPFLSKILKLKFLPYPSSPFTLLRRQSFTFSTGAKFSTAAADVSTETISGDLKNQTLADDGIYSNNILNAGVKNGDRAKSKLEDVRRENSLFTDHLCLLLQKCMKAKALRSCKQIHGLMLTTGIDVNLLSLSSKLIGAYASCGDLTTAKFLFRATENPNVFAFNWMISALTFSGFHQEAMCYVSLLQDSRKNGVAPNKYTFCVVLKACVGLLDVNKGKEVHGMIYKMGFEMDVSVCNSLVDMHAKCGDILYASKVFDITANKDVASWTSMICGFANSGNIKESVVLFERMRLEGLEPNHFTWNAMIAGHARRGDCKGAIDFFSRMTEGGLVPDLVTWNAMISGFVQGQRAGEALQVFCDMLIAGIKPNQVTVTGLLPACEMIGSIGRGKEIHGLIYRMGLYINAYVASALIDMYSKCGSVREAWNVFCMIPSMNVVSWNAMIGCYGKHGMISSALELFEKMQDKKIQANEVTMVSVLSCCVHGGLHEKGMEIFTSMRDLFGVEAKKEHYACIVDLLSRCGMIEEAYDIVKQMPMEVTDSVVGAFFNGCKIYARRDLAEKMAKYLRMDLKKPGGFVTLSNIYASEGDWEEVWNVRKAMKDKKVQKKPGSSWV